MTPVKRRHGINSVNLLISLLCGANAVLHGQVDIGVVPSIRHASRDVAMLAHVASHVNSSKKLPIPEVRHYKSAGVGYSEDSPLYTKQEKMREIGDLSVAPAVRGSTASTTSIPKVSTSMRCIINLTAQWFLVYTALFIIITLKNLGLATAREEGYLKSAADTVFFVPMLCVLFLATRLRAVQLAQGDTEKYDLPQWWVKRAMEVCAWSVLAETILALVYAMVYGDAIGSITEKRAETKRRGETVVLIFRYIIMVGIYAGFTTVVVGLAVMTGPEELWGETPPPVNPAMTCIIILAALYFIVYVALMIASMVNEFVEQQRFGPVKKFHNAVNQAAKREVEFAPMLCILFICARMRALQIDPVNGNPQRWAQICFYICTGSVVVQTFLAVCSNLFGQKSAIDKDQESNTENTILRVLEFVKWVVMALFFGALMIAIIAIFRLSIDLAPAHGRMPRLTPSLKCCLFLSAVYFTVYIAREVADTAQKLRDWKGQQYSGNPSRLTTIKEWLDGTAKDTVGFTPMLCTLFLGTWLRALQITGGTGTPPGWAQTFMYVATWCIPLKLVAHLDKVPKSEGLEKVFEICQHLCLLVMYSCCIAIIIALFTMTPETANGEGTITVLAPPVS